MVFSWCGCCRSRRQTRQNNNNNRRNVSDEDSEVYWMRRRREQQLAEQSKQREEFLANVLMTKVAVSGNSTDNEEDFFPLEREDGKKEVDGEGNAGADDAISCTICLVEYEEGDKVCFSHNPKCTHHFHKECAMEWLKDHDECPCCRCNYLAFSDDGNDEDQPNIRATPISVPVNPANDTFIDTSALFLARLFQTGPFEQPPHPQFASSRDGVVTGGGRDEWQFSHHDEGWEARLELWRAQVQERVHMAQQRLQEHRENNDQRHAATATGTSNNDSSLEQRMERSIERARSHFSTIREQLADRESRENVFQSVRARLQDVANSRSAREIRDRSQRTIQTITRQASHR